jgi:pleiotropic regulator 1
MDNNNDMEYYMQLNKQHSLYAYNHLYLDEIIKRNKRSYYISNNTNTDDTDNDCITQFKLSTQYKQHPSPYMTNTTIQQQQQQQPSNTTLLHNLTKNALISKTATTPKVKPHSKWKLYRVISGHTGWVRCIDVDPTNNWFVTGSNDRIIKFWDLPSGKLKLSLTGHINTVRGVVISQRHPYLFSCGEDKMIKCWDLEQNRVIRHYHGHLSGVYCLSLHPTLDVLITGGRDCVARVWDMRSRQQVLCLEGHNNTVCSVATQEHEPQVITGSNDCTVKLWDISSGKLMNTLTHHKKSIRKIVIPEHEYTFISGGCDNIKVFKCPEGEFIRNLSGHSGIINSIALNSDGVLVSAAEDGSLYMWDYDSGNNFQVVNVPVQPGSLECESGIFDVKFDKTSTRMITAGCDKTIKMWKEEIEDDNGDNEDVDMNEYN